MQAEALWSMKEKTILSRAFGAAAVVSFARAANYRNADCKRRNVDPGSRSAQGRL